MKKKISLVVLIAIVLGALAWQTVKREQSYFTHLNRITDKFKGEVQREYGFSCFGRGGSLAGNVKKVSLSFFCYEKKSIEEARRLELKCVERLREMINSNEKIRPHLEEFPFPPERVEIMLCFCKEDLSNFPPEESISNVISCRGKIFYDYEFDDDRPDETVLEETLAEAYEKLKGEQA